MWQQRLQAITLRHRQTSISRCQDRQLSQSTLVRCRMSRRLIKAAHVASKRCQSLRSTRQQSIRDSLLTCACCHGMSQLSGRGHARNQSTAALAVIQGKSGFHALPNLCIRRVGVFLLAYVPMVDLRYSKSCFAGFNVCCHDLMLSVLEELQMHQQLIGQHEECSNAIERLKLR
jgi:hypothetical protein